MVGADGVYHLRTLLVLLCELCTQKCVRKIRISIANLSYIVQKSCPLGSIWIETKFRSHYSTEVCSFTSMLEKVLTV